MARKDRRIPDRTKLFTGNPSITGHPAGEREDRPNPAGADVSERDDGPIQGGTDQRGAGGAEGLYNRVSGAVFTADRGRADVQRRASDHEMVQGAAAISGEGD